MKSYKIFYNLYCGTRKYEHKEIIVHNCSDGKHAYYKLAGYLRRTYKEYTSHQIVSCMQHFSLDNINFIDVQFINLAGGICIDKLDEIRAEAWK
jgi:hypothetical protein